MRRPIAIWTAAALWIGCGSVDPGRPRPAPTAAGLVSTAAAARTDRVVVFAGTPIDLAGDAGTAPFAIDPPLPAGVALDAATGAVRGTPAGAADGAPYRIVDAAGTERVVHLEVVAAPVPEDIFVATTGDDAAEGTQAAPLRTIGRALEAAVPGTRVFVAGGRYAEDLEIRKLDGAPDRPIVLRSVPGQRAVVAAAPAAITWQRATGDGAAPDEWVSAESFPWTKDDAVNRGAFVGRAPFTRLLTYSRVEDLRAANQRWTRDGSLPGVVTPSGNPKPWVYMGPGIHHDHDTGRVHLRLSPTTNQVAGLADWSGPTDPAQAPVAVWARDAIALRIQNASYIEIRDLVLEGGGDRTVAVQGSQHVTFDHVDVHAATMGLTIGESSAVRFLHGVLDGGIPTWSFRSDFKDNYKIPQPDGTVVENHLVRKTSRALVYVGGKVSDLEIGYSELVNAHDVYLAGVGADIHHCRFSNIHDDGLFISHVKDIDDFRIHDNVFERILTGISAEGRRVSGSRLIYRNIFDLRDPTAGYRPGGPNPSTWRTGHLFKGAIGVAPFYFYQNTVLLRPDKKGQPALLHYKSLEKDGAAAQPRWFVNNVVVVSNGLGPLTFVPDDSYRAAKGATGHPMLWSDGNAWVRMAAGKAPLFRCFTGKKGASCGAYESIGDVRTTGFEKQSQVATHPGFQKLGSIDASAADDDLRPATGSPALGTAVALPPDLPDAIRGPDAGALPPGAPPLRVGVDGRHAY